jgi:hypothetical protein
MRVRGRGGFDTANSTSVEAYLAGSLHCEIESSIFARWNDDKIC